MIQLLILLTLLQANFESDFGSLTVGDKISKEFAVKYLDADERFYGTYVSYITFMKPQLGDQFRTLIFKESTGTCLSQFLVTFNSKGELVSKLKIMSQCDHDGARPVYVSWSYELNNTERLLNIDRTTETVADKSIIGDDGFLIDGNSFHEVETTSETQFETYSISETGEVKRNE